MCNKSMNFISMKNTKFQLNICKIMSARPKNHWDMGCEYHFSLTEFCSCTISKLMVPAHFHYAADDKMKSNC